MVSEEHVITIFRAEEPWTYLKYLNNFYHWNLQRVFTDSKVYTFLRRICFGDLCVCLSIRPSVTRTAGRHAPLLPLLSFLFKLQRVTSEMPSYCCWYSILSVRHERLRSVWICAAWIWQCLVKLGDNIKLVSTQHTPSREADNSSATEEIPSILKNQKIHYRLHGLRQLSPTRTRLIQYTSYPYIYIYIYTYIHIYIYVRSILILSFHMCPCLPRDLSSSILLT